ncbi:DUF4239 domain-containing protein [Microvirga sp. 2MCAF38]|uniref:bestrophin-like domain n=1 Tax=Microvirga sp. 2MCAF38 TaxID=3232989 RepID=UPI003F9CABDC
MVFDTWLGLPVWGVFASLAVLLAASGLLVYWLCFGKRCRRIASSFGGVVAPFFGSVAILFALLMGFLANEVWDRNRQAARVVFDERDGLLALNAMTVTNVSDMEEVRDAIRHYVRILIDEEWPLMMDQESSPQAERAILALLAHVSAPKIGIEAGQATQGALLDTVLALRKARSERLALSGDSTDRTKWETVLVLAVITQIAIAVVHLERPRAQAAALSIFTAAAVAALGLVAIRERPFDGVLRFSAEPLVEALTTMTEPSKP